MVTAMQPPSPIERTEHPHVVKSADTLGGEPRVEGTRIPVRQILRLIEAGETADGIMREFPPLALSQIHDALSYAFDHPDEMAFHEDRHQLRTVMRKHDLVLVNHRLISRGRLSDADVPPGETVCTWETLPEGRE